MKKTSKKAKLFAYEFAGGAAMAYLLQVKIKGTSIKKEDKIEGFYEWEDLFNGKFYPMKVMFEDLMKLEKSAMVALAGPITESLGKNGKVTWTGEEDGYDYAMEVLSWVGPPDESTEKLFELYSKRCELILSCPDVWHAVEALAAHILQKRRLSGEEIERFLYQAFKKPTGE